VYDGIFIINKQAFIELKHVKPCAKLNNMLAIINELFFDKKMIKAVKQEKINHGLLYNQLMYGKITMKEYLHLCK
jgi:sulfopyruvate decarboxylase TPP-binding subunit